MPLKNPDNYRIICNNIGCIGVEATGNTKQNNIKDRLIRNEMDIFRW